MSKKNRLGVGICCGHRFAGMRLPGYRFACSQ